MNHRDAGAFERKAPSEKDVKAQQISEMIKTDQSKKRIESELSEEEILVVVSKVKAYIRSCSGMNTSDSVMNLLSQKVRKYANRAIEQAESQGRKTILDRDIL
jgi:hypothetical protein